MKQNYPELCLIDTHGNTYFDGDIIPMGTVMERYGHMPRPQRREHQDGEIVLCRCVRFGQNGNLIRYAPVRLWSVGLLRSALAALVAQYRQDSRG